MPYLNNQWRPFKVPTWAKAEHYNDTFSLAYESYANRAPNRAQFDRLVIDEMTRDERPEAVLDVARRVLSELRVVDVVALAFRAISA